MTRTPESNRRGRRSRGPAQAFTAAVAVSLSLLLAVLAADAGAATRPASGTDAMSTAVSQVDPVTAEAAFVARINQLRTSRGLGALQVDPQLTGLARSWASTMGGAGRIFHASNLASGVTADWTKLGENVGVGGNVDELFQAFVASPGHLANLVDPAFTQVGVGVVLAGGRIYTTHRFMATAAPGPAPTAPPTTSSDVAPPPPSTTRAPEPTTSVAPTTAPPAPTTTAPTTTPPTTQSVLSGPPSKLGPIERIAELV